MDLLSLLLRFDQLASSYWLSFTSLVPAISSFLSSPFSLRFGADRSRFCRLEATATSNNITQTSLSMRQIHQYLSIMYGVQHLQKDAQDLHVDKCVQQYRLLHCNSYSTSNGTTKCSLYRAHTLVLVTGPSVLDKAITEKGRRQASRYENGISRATVPQYPQ
ncbi:hypothetical protein ABG067_001723 [Albugo candida]